MADATRRTLSLIAGYGAIASALPYLALKIVWLSGGMLGIADERIMHDPSLVALNAITAGMDVVAIGLALAFTHRWGLRVPAWLLLPPMWVATGLLSTFVVAVPIAAAAAALTPGTLPRVSGGPVQPWVYIVVYTEFAGMGIGLMVAFFLYARNRWADTLQSTTRAIRPGPTRDVQAPLANAAALAAAALGALYLAWAFGATLGLAPQAAARRTIAGTMINSVDGLLMWAAAAGVLIIVHRIGSDVPFWRPLLLTWIGTGSMFGWGAWQMINVLGQTALMRSGERLALVHLAGLLRLVLGLVMGLLTLFVLAERRAAAARDQFLTAPDRAPFSVR